MCVYKGLAMADSNVDFWVQQYESEKAWLCLPAPMLA